jgi:DNA-binding transcriptional MerR regulator
MTYTIGDLSAELGITQRAIRFYEDEGLLAPGREGLSRVYTHRDRARLILICRGKRLGFSLAEIKEFLDLYAADPGQVEQVRYARERAQARIAALEVQLADVRQTLDELRKIEADMGRHLAAHGAEPDAGTDRNLLTL